MMGLAWSPQSCRLQTREDSACKATADSTKGAAHAVAGSSDSMLTLLLRWSTKNSTGKPYYGRLMATSFPEAAATFHFVSLPPVRYYTEIRHLETASPTSKHAA